MALGDSIRRALDRVTTSKATTVNAYGAGTTLPLTFGAITSTTTAADVLGMTPAHLWRTQPYLRTVVNFMARNIAQLGLKTYERVGETDRRRLRDDPVAQLLSRPNSYTTGYELIYQLVADLALYDDAYWYISEDVDAPSGYKLDRLPPSWVVGTRAADVFTASAYLLQAPSGASQTIPADRILHFHGWTPDNPLAGSSPIGALRQILAEQVHAQSYRAQVWQRGGRVGAVLTRPAGAPDWSDSARKRFSADWRARWTGDDGTSAGGTPILEDGMTLNSVRFSANEEQFVEAAKLALNIVASVYHVNPTMIGLLDNANFSNVREFRRSLYGDTLGPVMAQIEDRLNTFLVPRITDTPAVYVEFNINEKLQGSFEEQTQALQASVGRPYMTANEARALQNMPALDGDAGQLVTPLNVVVGGQASPLDSGSQNLGSGTASGRPRAVKARADDRVLERATKILGNFFDRQGRVLASSAGNGMPVWDGERWDAELADELEGINVLISTAAGRAALASLGYDPSEWDTERVREWLRTNAERAAVNINDTTRSELTRAVLTDESGDTPSAIRSLFTGLVAARAGQIAATQVSGISGFATTETARQLAPETASKTWNVTSGDPRSTHARLNGQTVKLGETFSNGALWPGDQSLPAEERANCRCNVTINLDD